MLRLLAATPKMARNFLDQNWLGKHLEVVSSERGKTIPNFQTYLESLLDWFVKQAFPLLD